MCLSSLVATLHSARRHFGSMDIAGETFLELWETPRLPADHLLSPSSSISFSLVSVALFLSCLCSRPAGSDRVLNCLPLAFCAEQVSFLWTGRRKDRPSQLLSDLTVSTELESCCLVEVSVSFAADLSWKAAHTWQERHSAVPLLCRACY